eukprot:6020929-Pleurochrysis_carterae.AAC.1
MGTRVNARSTGVQPPKQPHGRDANRRVCACARARVCACACVRVLTYARDLAGAFVCAPTPIHAATCALLSTWLRDLRACLRATVRGCAKV